MKTYLLCVYGQEYMVYMYISVWLWRDGHVIDFTGWYLLNSSENYFKLALLKWYRAAGLQVCSFKCGIDTNNVHIRQCGVEEGTTDNKTLIHVLWFKWFYESSRTAFVCHVHYFFFHRYMKYMYTIGCCTSIIYEAIYVLIWNTCTCTSNIAVVISTRVYCIHYIKWTVNLHIIVTKMELWSSEIIYEEDINRTTSILVTFLGFTCCRFDDVLVTCLCQGGVFW